MNTAFTVDTVDVEVRPDASEAGAAAARWCADTVRAALQRQGSARIVFATGNSQLTFLAALAACRGIDWQAVTIFHLDEYVGLDADHPASFCRWIRTDVAERLGVGTAHFLDGTAEPRGEAERYTALLREAPLDLVCCGVGENGHLAFNEPGTDFTTKRWVDVVTLDDRSRAQQVGEGHFPSLADVPAQALSLTVPAVMSAAAVQVVVPERRKAEALRTMLTGEISPACPASILRTHPRVALFADADAASLLPPHA